MDESDDELDAEESGEQEMEEDGESAMSASSSDSVPFDAKALKKGRKSATIDDSDDEAKHKKQLLQKLEGDAEASDEELDAALDLVLEGKKEETK